MEPARPRPVAVGQQPPEAAPAPRPAPHRTPWIVAGLLAVLLTIALGALVQQGRQARSLAAELGVTRAELGRAQAAVRAHQGRLEEVRAAVSGLQELVSRDPLAPSRAPR